MSGRNAGCRGIEVVDAVQGAAIAVRLFYPTGAEEKAERFGPFTVEVAIDAPLEGHDLPLVVVSHGTGSTVWLFRDLARHLARSGFVVALVMHPGNNRFDDALAGRAINLVNRPRHLRLAIDAVFAQLGEHLSPGVSVIGHSIGGYTALALAGGRPHAFQWETEDGKPGPIDVTHDARVEAVVLLAPATVWLGAEGALKGVTVPILMRTGGSDVHAEALHGQIVERGVPDRARLDHRVVPNAGHFAFVSLYPPELTSPAVPPSQDPEGFDRAAYLPVLFDEITTFLRRAAMRE